MAGPKFVGIITSTIHPYTLSLSLLDSMHVGEIIMTREGE
jgi:hypothetical protein